MKKSFFLLVLFAICSGCASNGVIGPATYALRQYDTPPVTDNMLLLEPVKPSGGMVQAVCSIIDMAVWGLGMRIVADKVDIDVSMRTKD